MSSQQRVVIGMSGGVDSSAAAWLLRDQGYQVVGVTFVAYDSSVHHRGGTPEEVDAAREVCAYLDIPHHLLDWREAFRRRVIEPFMDHYSRGLTPNPCMLCNREIKFGLLADFADQCGGALLSTGHYARVEGNRILRGEDPAKDQSYFLAMVRPEVVSRMVFPLAGYTKAQVRAVVEKAGLPIAPQKGESQDICFTQGDYRDFLEDQGLTAEPGPFLLKGQPVGRHRGIPFYSLGQRRGLGVAAGHRLYVRELDLQNNAILLGERPLVRVFRVFQVNPFQEFPPAGGITVQIRYQSRPLPVAFLEPAGSDDPGVWQVTLSQPFPMITPGQFAVFYQGDHVAAGSVIRDIDLLSESVI